MHASAPVAKNDSEQHALSGHWRERYYTRAKRLEKLHHANVARRKLASESAAQLMKQPPSKPINMGVWTPPPTTLPTTAPIMSQEKAQSDIAAAVARAKARKAALRKPS